MASQSSELPFATAVGVNPSLKELLKAISPSARRVRMPGAFFPVGPNLKSLKFQSAEFIRELPREVIPLEESKSPSLLKICSLVYPSDRLPEELMTSTPGAITNKLLRLCVSAPSRRNNILEWFAGDKKVFALL